MIGTFGRVLHNFRFLIHPFLNLGCILHNLILPSQIFRSTHREMDLSCRTLRLWNICRCNYTDSDFWSYTARHKLFHIESDKQILTFSVQYCALSKNKSTLEWCLYPFWYLFLKCYRVLVEPSAIKLFQSVPTVILILISVSFKNYSRSIPSLNK